MSKEIEYPCYMENTFAGLKILFVSRNKGYVQEAGGKRYPINEFIESVDAEYFDWKPYKPSRFKDGVIVLCWNNNQLIPVLRRWDAINDSVCWSDGARDGNEYDNYKLSEGKLPFVLPKIKD